MDDWSALQPLLLAACTAGAAAGSFLGTLAQLPRLRSMVDTAVKRAVAHARREERARIEALEKKVEWTPRKWSDPDE